MVVAFMLVLAGCGAESAPAENVAGNMTTTVEESRATGQRVASAATLQDFWPRFRRAALAGDAAALRSMSAPVVLQRSSLDDSPALKLAAARVPAAVAKILTLPDGVDAAGRSHRAILEATPVAKRDAQQPENTYRFGDLVFARGKAGWKLTEIYLDD